MLNLGDSVVLKLEYTFWTHPLTVGKIVQIVEGHGEYMVRIHWSDAPHEDEVLFNPSKLEKV